MTTVLPSLLSLEQVIEQTAQCADAMLSCLLTERENLLARKVHAVEESTQTKLALFDALEKLEIQRRQLFEDGGFDPENVDMSRLLRGRNNTTVLVRTWNRALDTLTRCREANQVNGGILELGRRQAEQALAILRGQVAQPRLYGSGGETSMSLDHRELGKA